jgi:hypothetical protein
MKRKCTITGYLMLTWITIFLNIDLISFSQEEITRAPFQNDELILKLPKAGLRLTITDTILPVICNSGLGLLNYKCFYLMNNEKDWNYNAQDGRNSTAIREDVSESDLRILKNQQRLMDEQYHYELQQQIRKDKMDLGLGEIIKGFYMKPVY